MNTFTGKAGALQSTDKSAYVSVYNGDVTDAPPYAALEIYGFDPANNWFLIRRPTLGGRNDLLFAGTAPVRAGQSGQGIRADRALALIERDSDVPPASGETWGCVPGNWALVRYSTGYTFISLPVDAENVAIVTPAKDVNIQMVQPQPGAINAGQIGKVLQIDARPGQSPTVANPNAVVQDSDAWVSRHVGNVVANEIYAVDFNSSFRKFRVAGTTTVYGSGGGSGLTAYTLVEVVSKADGTGYVDKSGGITTTAFEANNFSVPTGKIVKANIRKATTGGVDGSNNTYTGTIWEFWYEGSTTSSGGSTPSGASGTSGGGSSTSGTSGTSSGSTTSGTSGGGSPTSGTSGGGAVPITTLVNASCSPSGSGTRFYTQTWDYSTTPPTFVSNGYFDVGCCGCGSTGSTASGGSSGGSSPTSGSSGMVTTGQQSCCPRAMCPTMSVTLGGGYGLFPLYWNASDTTNGYTTGAWLGSSTVCGSGTVITVWVSAACNVIVQVGTQRATEFALSVTCGPPYVASGTVLNGATVTACPGLTGQTITIREGSC